jgi:polar amino acid transport system substrate-binding protein
MIFKAIKFSTLAICYLLHLSASAQAQVKQLNLVGEYIESATNLDGTGFQFEMVKAIFEPLGYKVNITVYPYKRALKGVETGQADMMVGMIKHNDMPLIFSQVPHEADRILAIFLKKNVSDWQGVASIKNKRVVILSSLVENAKEKLPILNNHISEVRTPAQALKMLMYNRADFMIMTEAEYLINHMKSPQVELIAKPISFIQIHAAFTPTKKGVALKKVWDKHFIPYFKSKEATAMYKSWSASKHHKVTLEFLNQENN